MASDDDFFSDDDLDNIPTNTLDQLEQQAVYTSTQKAAVAAAVNHPPAPLRKQAYNADSLNRAGGTGLNRNLPWRPPQPSRPPTQHYAHIIGNAPPASTPEPPSSDYGLDDEEVINLDEPSMVIQPASRPTNTSRTSYQNRQPPRQASKKDVDLEAEAAFAAADAELGSQTLPRWPQAHPVQPAPNGGSMDVSAMLARIQELEAERERLRRAEEVARNEALAKQGEIAIVRSNQDREKKQFEARLSVMQKLHADESARQKAEIEANRKEREKMETDNRFLQHDLAQEAERAKRSAGTRRVPTQRDTPRKSKRTGLGDGFDDTELQPSPSQSRDKAGEHTPKIGAKRKRPANDSPVAALSFIQPQPVLRKESTKQTNGSSFGPPVVETVVVHDNTKYKYIQQILNHRPHNDHERTVEALTKYALPSNPDKTLASIFHDELSRPGNDDDHLPRKLARICLYLWAGCLHDQYLSPFYLILDMLFLALYGESSKDKAQLIEEATPLCCRTIDFIARPAARVLKGQVFTKEESQTHDLWAKQLDVDSVMDLLYTFCGAASLTSERNEVFWNTIDLPFVLQTLGRAQPVSHNITMLRMVATSARSTTFGTIMGDAKAQPQQERQVIERLTVLLFEKLKVCDHAIHKRNILTDYNSHPRTNRHTPSSKCSISTSKSSRFSEQCA